MSYFPFKIVRRDADTTPVADGDRSELVTNSLGRLKVSAIPGAIASAVGDITTNQSSANTPVANGTLYINTERISNLVASVVMTGVTSATYTFEHSNNSTNGIDGTWYQIQVVRSNANTIEPVTLAALSATPVYSWEMSVNAYKWVRVRSTAGTYTATTGKATWTLMPGTYATEPIPAIQTHAVTLTSTTVAASSTATGFSVYYNAALTNTDVAVKTSLGRIYGWDFYNPNSSDVYVNFYNALIANVTPGTTTPMFSLRIPANSGRDWNSTIPISMGAAITIAATTTQSGGAAPTSPIEAKVDFI